MIVIQITFEGGNTICTGWNGTLEDAIYYYVGRPFELTEGKPQVKGMNVVLLK